MLTKNGENSCAVATAFYVIFFVFNIKMEVKKFSLICCKIKTLNIYFHNIVESATLQQHTGWQRCLDKMSNFFLFKKCNTNIFMFLAGLIGPGIK